jgi:hypothetical protein
MKRTAEVKVFLTPAVRVPSSSRLAPLEERDDDCDGNCCVDTVLGELLDHDNPPPGVNSMCTLKQSPFGNVILGLSSISD